MAITPAHEAIAKIIELAENGEINPWDVPVIDIIDRFLGELGLNDSLDANQVEANLPQSGQAFVWASMLVLLKAETLQLLQEPEELELPEGLEEEEFTLAQTNRRLLPTNLEDHLKRRSAAAPVRTRRVSLQELIQQLEHIASELESSSVTPNSTSTRSSRSRQEAMRAISQLAHNENLTELAIQLEQFLYRNLPQLFPQQNYIDWEQLISSWQNSDRPQENHSHENQPTSEKAGIFWALLLLSSQSKVELSQQEFYQDLSIRPLNA
ncbi:condensin subunit ScpA [Stanieria cyanosphaera PCC 7437]|uniref:Segregation and condensation protein A n=1 Tax=Stanieria cyanosphaera (strain ATCC 29371 / PCC 7437) TaxID=111780 RepID=K9XW99_STAC7|nr:segregation/condensation protein A [Stanieria cyanosphaera]AFZ35942.1 condensin subunit ScpA [Stanieria cyanosphaera PCC 7437]